MWAMTEQQPEAEFDDDVWTDCHFYPRSTTWQPTAGSLPRVLGQLGITRVGALTLNAEDDDWQAEEPADPLFEAEDVSLEALPALIAEHGARHASILVELAGTPLEDLAMACRRQSGERGGRWCSPSAGVQRPCPIRRSKQPLPAVWVGCHRRSWLARQT